MKHVHWLSVLHLAAACRAHGCPAMQHRTRFPSPHPLYPTPPQRTWSIHAIPSDTSMEVTLLCEKHSRASIKASWSEGPRDKDKDKDKDKKAVEEEGEDGASKTPARPSKCEWWRDSCKDPLSLSHTHTHTQPQTQTHTLHASPCPGSPNPIPYTPPRSLFALFPTHTCTHAHSLSQRFRCR